MRRGSIILSILFLTYFQINSFAQSGPAGIGNATGNNGQPTNILWLRADDLSLSDGAAVNTWADQSGNSHDLGSSVNDPNDPNFYTNQINSLPVVRFNSSSGTGTKLISNPFNGFAESEITSIIVYKTGDSGDGLVSYAVSGDNNHFLLFNNGDLTSYIAGGNQSSGLALNGNAFQIVVHKWKNSNGELHLFQNGTDQYNRTGFRTGTTLTDGGSLAIGGEQDGLDASYDQGQAFDGDIAEIIMFSSYLNDAQRIIIENYLNVKYGITIAKDVFASNDAAYIYNLTGIGQEADGAHLSSSSAGFYIQADAGTLDNGEYIMFAHNNTANSVSINDLPAGVEARWAKDWFLEKTGSQNATLVFDLPEGISGQYPQNISNYVLLFRNTTTGSYSQVTATVNYGDADQIAFSVTDANLLNGYYTLGTTDQTNSPVEGAAGVTWYTLASGNWNDYQIWTLDPSGALPNNPDNSYPQNPSDKVVIKSGKNVNMNVNNIHCNSLTVDGRLDLNTSSGHTFDIIKGNGRILMAADNFPAFTDMSNFNTAGQGEGTVVFYGSSDFSLSTPYTFYNMEVDMTTGNTITLLTDYTINGYLRVLNGTFQINDNTATTNLNFTVQGNLTVETGASILTGTGNARHQFNFYGDFTNNGTVKFTNRTAADYANEATDGIVDANFLNTTKDQSILCNGTTNFYRIEIDKGTDATYILDIQATSTANFNLFGYAAQNHSSTAQLASNTNALGLLRGTVKIGSNVTIPVLSTGSNYNISEAARLWIAGGTVQKNSGNAIVPYGVLEVSAGLFESKISSGITTRDNGLIKISGGVINTNVIRTSVLGAGNVGGYVQSGGTVNVVSTGTSDYYHFCLTYPGNTFSMSGGTLHVYNSTGSGNNQGGIFIASNPENINVTGGTVIAEIQTPNPFIINSRAPFYNLILRNTLDNTTDHVLDNATNVGSTDENQTAQPLVVLNDLTIEDNVMLKHNGQDITIGGDLSISRNAQAEGVASDFIESNAHNRGIYYSASQVNTLRFNGSGNSSFYIGYNTSDVIQWEFYCHNLEINKDNRTDTITISTDSEKDPVNVSSEWHNRIIHVIDTIWVRKGVIDQGRQSVRLFGEIFGYKDGQMGVYDVNVPTPNTAYFMFRDGDVVVNTEKGAVFGNIKFNSTGTVTFTSDIYIKRIGYYSGLYNIGSYKLKVDYLHSNATSNNYSFAVNNSKMIYSDANASDGGIEIYIPANSSGYTIGLPLGTTANGITRSTPAEIRVDSNTDDGYIQIRPVDGELRTTNLAGGNLLSYYWRVGHSEFSTAPDVRLRFRYNAYDDDANDEGNFVQGKVLDEDPYTRSSPSGWVNTSNNTIGFNTNPLEKANYTAGVANRFTGIIDQYYAYWDVDGQSAWPNAYSNWDDASTWEKGSIGSGVNEVPSEGSIVHIGGRKRVWGNNIPNIPAEVILEFDNAKYGTTDQENVPRLQFNSSGPWDIGKVSGVGMVSFNNNNDPVVTADWGEFANNSSNFIMYWGANQIHTNIIQPCPSLMLEGYTQQIDQNIVINGDLILTGGTTCIPLQDVHVKRNLYPGAWSNGTLRFPSSGNTLTMTIDGNIDYTYIRTTTTRSIIVENATSSLEHKLIVKGDINLGTENSFEFNLWRATDRPKVLLELQGDTNNKYYTTSTIVPKLYRIVMNKGTSQADTFTFKNNIILNGPTSGVNVKKAIELQNGTLVLDDPNINLNLTSGDDDFIIPSTAGLEVRQGQVNANGNSGILLDGKLKVSGGTVNMSGGDNYIQYSASGSATIDVTAGTLTVGSQIRRGTSSTEGILTYKQSGGTVTIGTDAAGENSRGIFEILNAGSNFEHTGGTFTLVNDYRTNPSIASFYFNPENTNLASGTEITIGNSNTALSAHNFSIYPGKALENLTIDNTSSNNPILTMQVVPLTLNEDLNISSGSELDANTLDIYMIGGDFNNNGTFTANQNKVYFTADTTQSINGITNFYDLYKTNGTDTLKLGNNSEITVEHYLSLESGLFFDNGNNVNVKGNLNNIIATLSLGSGDGMVLNGSTEQTITGSGTYARLTIDNPANITVPTGNNITITDSLQMKQGIFDIGKNLLILTKEAEIVEAAPFSESNMISTNISFTDAGVKKYFPIINSSTLFTFPMGSAGKYTPVSFNITANANNTGSIRIRAANERHPSIIEDSEAPNPEITDAENVLWYYWTIDANGIEGFSATATMQSYASDVHVTSPYTDADYITARLLDASLGTWDKFSNLDFNESNSELYFYYTGTNDQGIDGDYTAGIDDAIPDQVPGYISIADGDWSDASIWDTYPTSGGSVPAGGPRGSIVYIQNTVTTPANFVSAYITRMLPTGVLNLGTTFGHRLGFVSGTGKIYLESGDLPAGVYDDFFATDSGTIEYGGANAIDILSEITAVNNLILSGSNDRIFPNLDLVIRGNLTINGPDVKNTHNESVEVRKDVTFTSGTFDAGFDDGSDVNNGMFIIGGSSTQHIYGPATFTETNAFNHFKMNNPIGIILDQPVDIDNQLVFVNGPITTTSTNILTLHNTANNIVTGAGAGNYVDGPLKKNIINGQSFNFPTGNAGRYGNIRVFNTGTTGNDYWIAQYYNHNPGNEGYDPTNYKTPLQTVSDNEYWRVMAPVSTTAQIELRWDSQSGMPTDAANVGKTRIAEWKTTAPQWEELDPNNTFSAAGSTGTVTSTVSSSFNEWATGNIFTLSTTYVSQDFTWDGSENVVWNNAANWNVNLVPTALDSVIIASGMPNDPTISINAECGGMDLQNGVTLTINSGASLTLSGDLVMNGNILLKSDANGTGVLIDNGNIGGTGTATVERFLTGQKYHYLSAPLSAIPHTTYYAQLPGETQVNTNYYWYDESNANSNWLYGWVAQNGSGNMTVGKGYAYYYTKDYTFVQSGGSFNTGNISVNVTNSNNGVSSDGWNLIGNPYPSTILADEFIYNNNSVIDGTLYFWDDPETNGNYTSSDYATWNLAGAVGTGSGTASNSITPDGYIGVSQSFFVHSNAGGTVNFTNSMRRIGNGQFFKDAKYDGVGRLKLSISNDQTKIYNELLIAFIDGASDRFDNLYDGKKMKGNADIAFYSKLNGDDYAIQSFAPLKAYSEKIVNLGFMIANSNTYTITVQQFENFDTNVRVYLKDKQLDSTIDLRSQNSYVFTTNAGTFDDRFEVFFNYLPANDGMLNHTPVLNAAIPDLEATEDMDFEYRIATNTFKDADIQDTLQYTAKLLNGSALPDWLNFNNQTLTFTGIPENKDVDVLTIQLTASDLSGESVYDVFVLNVLNVNDAPEIVNPIHDQSINAGEEYSFIIPQNTFTDVDKNDTIQLSVKLSDGSGLPAWLNFDEQTGKLYGTAEGSGDIAISITATDKEGAATSDEFILTVKSVTGISSLSESKVSIYPNPTSGKFIIETGYVSEDMDIIIRDLKGKIIQNIRPVSRNTEVNISDYASGTYFVEIKDKTESFIHKITLNK